jgi:hypothetical protein
MPLLFDFPGSNTTSVRRPIARGVRSEADTFDQEQLIGITKSDIQNRAPEHNRFFGI